MAVKISGVEVIDNSRNITTNIGTVDGRDIAADGAKLDGIASGAEVNQNAFSSIAVAGQSDVVADTKTDAVTFVAGTGVSITTDASTDVVTFTNSAPDQVVSLTGSGATSVSGTYPNFTISSTDNNTTYTAGSGLTLTGTSFSANIGTDILAYDANLQSFVSTFTLPTADGSTGQVLTTNGAGTLSFSTITGYTDADVDAHLNTGTAASGEVLSWNGTDYDWIAAPAALLGDTDSASPFETSLGFEAGLNTTGVNNTFVGYQAGKANTTGNNNVAVGYQALAANTTGRGNVAIGGNALGVNTTSGDNVAVGWGSLRSNTGGVDNSAVGRNTLYSNTSGYYNMAFGYNSLFAVTTGIQNVGVGALAGSAITTGSNNVAIGNGALYAATTGGRNIAIGQDAMGLGVATTASGDNVAVGYRAGNGITTGSENVLVGKDAGISITDGSFNIAIGYETGGGVSTATRTVFIGPSAGSNASNGMGIGYRAARYSSGESNTAVGNQALADTLLTGNTNSAFGYQALFNVESGNGNTGVGYVAGSNITTGSNNMVLGNLAQASSATVSNEITLGNSSITTLRCQVTTITSLSDARDKTDIQPLNAGLEFVEALNPVSFTWNMRDGGKVGEADTGFIAQDLQKAQADLGVTIPDLVYDVNPDKLEAGYGKLIPVLVQAIKDLSAEVKTLKTQMEAQQ